MLPSLTTLQLFVAAARHLGVSRAAETMGMTQSAASRRIAALEGELGLKLFERHRRGLRLTRPGEAYLAAVAPALETIASVTAQLRVRDTAAPLRLRVYSTFAVKWLLPRLPRFQALHPGLEVRLDTTVSPVSFDRDGIDLAIQFGNGHWPDAETQLLVPDLIEPVCAPAFARRHALGSGSADLRDVGLLDSHYRRADWNDWAIATGTRIEGAARAEFPSSLLSFQAAIEGLGMAMGQPRLLKHELETGRLVAPLHRPVRREAGYYLVAPRNGSEPRRVRLFRNWIGGLTGADLDLSAASVAGAGQGSGPPA